MGNKECRKCAERKPLDCFYKDKSRSDGFKNVCKTCDAARLKARYYANHEESKAQSRQWFAQNKERRSEYDRIKHLANKEARNKQAREWREKHPERMAAYKVNWQEANREHYNTRKRINEGARRARKNAAMFASFTDEQLEARLAYYGNKCWMCKHADYTEIDHVKPLSRGGAHILANLRPACSPCNRSKSAVWPFVIPRAA